MDIATLRLLVLPISAFVSFHLGLAGAGINLLKHIRLESARKGLSLFAGVCGLLAIIFYLMDAHDPVFAQFHTERHIFNLITALGCSFTALCVGVESFGINILKLTHLTHARKFLEFMAGVIGGYGLILYFK